MGLRDTVEALRHWRWLPARHRWRAGDTEGADARRIADAERAAGAEPTGCAWLDERTVADLDLPLVFRTLDRTVTPTGAQALWRWLAAPAHELDVLAARERSLARLAAEPELRARIRDVLAGQVATDAPHLPRLLWEPPAPPVRTIGFAVLAGVLGVLALLAVLWPPLVVGCLVLLIVNVFLDEHAHARSAHQGRALGVLRQVLAAVDRITSEGLWTDHAITKDLAAFAGLRRGVVWLTFSDPFGILELLRAGFHVRSLALGKLMREVDRERDRLRRVVLWLGELDALVSIASLRTERPDTRVPWLSTGAAKIAARGIVHPAISSAIGNDLVLDAGLLVTGSNMSGKSTFLRAIAINAVCAQSIHTTFGTWCASLVRVFAVMRITDATAQGQSTFAVEVDAIGALVEAATPRDHTLPALFVLDEPFSGTNPALRVPIVVSVLEYCRGRNLVVAATHDLDVAEQVDEAFARGYFAEMEDDRGQFDRRLRAGVSPSSNALALLGRAGYPPEILEDVQRRVSAAAG